MGGFGNLRGGFGSGWRWQRKGEVRNETVIGQQSFRREDPFGGAVLHGLGERSPDSGLRPHHPLAVLGADILAVLKFVAMLLEPLLKLLHLLSRCLAIQRDDHADGIAGGILPHHGWIVILAVCGAFGLLLFAFGLLQFPTRAARLDTTKAIANSNPDGMLVTDRESQIVYANDAYRALSGARAAGDLRPVERLFTGSPDVSESVYRLSQAAKSGARASEELRLSPPPKRRGRGRPGTAFACARSRARPRMG